MKWKLKVKEKLDAMQKEFLHTAADRLKTPVTTLGLALQRMEDVKTEDERKKFLKWQSGANGNYHRQ